MLAAVNSRHLFQVLLTYQELGAAGKHAVLFVASRHAQPILELCSTQSLPYPVSGSLLARCLHTRTLAVVCSRLLLTAAAPAGQRC